jgi:hypothetical protein
MPTDQRRFDFAGRKVKSAHFKLAEYDRKNLETARYVLADPARFDTPTSRCVLLWARLVIERLGAPEERQQAA